MQIVKALSVWVFLLSMFLSSGVGASESGSAHPGIRMPIEWGDLSFSYQENENPETLVCKHRIENPLSQDWKVSCVDRTGQEKRKYGVHLWVTQYQNPAGEAKIEVLYWVTDRSQPRVREYSGSTLWFYFKNQADLKGLSLSQSVENDQARLRVEIKP